MSKNHKMEIIAGLFIVVGTALGVWANAINKKEAKVLEEKNASLLSENNNLGKELKIKSQENIALSKRISKSIEAVNYFNTIDFSYLKKDFPYGYTVVRQNKDFDDFIKVYGEKRGYEYYGSEIYYDKEQKTHLIKFSGFKIEIMGGSMSGGEMAVGLNTNNYKDFQLLIPEQPLFDVNWVVLMIDDGHKYTYAIGFVPKEPKK